MLKLFRNERGFTLIETMIAAAILAVGILAYARMQTTAISGNSTGISITGKTNWAADQIEKLLAMPYDDLVALDADGDGTNQDPLETGRDQDDNGDDIVDDNEKFGLHHNTVATADGNATSPDANNTYTIFWNVAVDKPLRNMATLNVIVSSIKQNANQKPVELQYIKSRSI